MISLHAWVMLIFSHSPYLQVVRDFFLDLISFSLLLQIVRGVVGQCCSDCLIFAALTDST